MKIWERQNYPITNDDQRALAALLVKMGYFVHIGKGKPPGSDKAARYVEYGEKGPADKYGD